ncbi:MAG: hypothetical protein IPH72_32355 [Sandaracinaceae bacterium]|nr:hypothetical protein [Sandaracinaceae bacterium]
MLAASAPEVHARWVANISDHGWYPATLLNIIEVADRRFGKGDRKFVVDAGAHLADAARRAGRMDHMKSPELCFMQVAPLLGSLFCHGQPRAHEARVRYGELEVTGHPRPTLTLAVLMVGFVQRALMRGWRPRGGRAAGRWRRWAPGGRVRGDLVGARLV